MTPYQLWQVIDRSLRKNRAERTQTALELCTDLKAVQKDVESGTVLVDIDTRSQTAAPIWRQPLAMGFATVTLIVGLTTAWVLKPSSSGPSEPLRKFQITHEFTDGAQKYIGSSKISPDGSMVAYTANLRLWVRDMDSIEPREIPDSKNVKGIFWSPDSEYLGYYVSPSTGASSTIKIAPSRGGPSRTLVKLGNQLWLSSYTWRPDGMIVYRTWSETDTSSNSDTFWTVSHQGGEPHELIEPALERNKLTVLPNGYLMYSKVQTDTSSGDKWAATRYFGSDITRQTRSTEIYLKSGDTERKIWEIPGSGQIRYSSSGHLVYTVSGAIWAVPFSLSSLEVTGLPVRIVAETSGAFSLSSEGTLVYPDRWKRPDPMQAQLVWVDRHGRVEETIGQPLTQMVAPSIAPGTRRVAVSGSAESTLLDIWVSGDIWIHDADRGTAIRLAPNPNWEGTSTWSPEGDQVIFASRRIRFWPDGRQRLNYEQLFVISSDGMGEPDTLARSEFSMVHPDWSSDGRYVAFTFRRQSTNTWDLGYLSLEDREPLPLIRTPSREAMPVFSPDGRYVAYSSDETGRWEVYVSRFPEGTGKWQVSVNGGLYPRWKGNEIFYVENNKMMVASVQIRPTLRIEKTELLFVHEQVGTYLDYYFRYVNFDYPWLSMYDVAPDGQRFVMIDLLGERKPGDLVVMQNWTSLLEQAE